MVRVSVGVGVQIVLSSVLIHRANTPAICTYTANPIFSHPPEAKFMNLKFEVSGHYLESSHT